MPNDKPFSPAAQDAPADGPRRRSSRAGASSSPRQAASSSLKRNAVWVALIMAVASMISVQTGVSLAVPVIGDYGPLSTSALRICWAALVLFMIVRPPLHRFTAAQWRATLVLGAAMAVMSLAFFAALERLPQYLAIALEFCGPLAVAALGVRGWRALAWPLLAAIGIVLLVWGNVRGGQGADGLGIAFALLAALGWAIYIIMMKRIGRNFPGLQGLTASLLAAAVLSLPFAVAEAGTILFPWPLLGLTAGLAVLVPLVPYILEMLALRRLPAAAFGVLMSLEPAIGALSGWLILGQGMVAGQMLGVGLVVIASIGVVRAGR